MHIFWGRGTPPLKNMQWFTGLLLKNAENIWHQRSHVHAVAWFSLSTVIDGNLLQMLACHKSTDHDMEHESGWRFDFFCYLRLWNYCKIMLMQSNWLHSHRLAKVRIYEERSMIHNDGLRGPYPSHPQNAECGMICVYIQHVDFIFSYTHSFHSNNCTCTYISYCYVCVYMIYGFLIC